MRIRRGDEMRLEYNFGPLRLSGRGMGAAPCKLPVGRGGGARPTLFLRL